MKFFAHTRSRRHTAFVVLLVWLFALASGVANACLLETHELHSTAGKGSAAATPQTPAGWAGHLAGVAGHDDSDNTKESCLKVCDDGTRTVLKAPSAVEHSDPGPASLVTILWTESPLETSAPRRLDALAIPIAGPPFRVRYSRLAL